jgi:hypothetical protein
MIIGKNGRIDYLNAELDRYKPHESGLVQLSIGPDRNAEQHNQRSPSPAVIPRIPTGQGRAKPYR